MGTAGFPPLNYGIDKDNSFTPNIAVKFERCGPQNRALNLARGPPVCQPCPKYYNCFTNVNKVSIICIKSPAKVSKIKLIKTRVRFIMLQEERANHPPNAKLEVTTCPESSKKPPKENLHFFWVEKLLITFEPKKMQQTRKLGGVQKSSQLGCSFPTTK